MSVRSVGVEEEMFLVDPATGEAAPVSDQVVEAAGGGLEQELFLQQVETTSDPQTDLAELRGDLVARRRLAGESADKVGVALAAMASPVLPAVGVPTPKPRYRTMLAEFGAVARHGLVCATHVHVGVDEHEAVPIIDDLRPWLPLVVAVSTNSPYADGADTGYASWREQMWDSWPSAGPVEPFGDLEGYRAAMRTFVASGAALDEAMIYLDARLARGFPTVEIRVADVCTDVDDAVLVAELCRALVEVTVRDRAAGRTPEDWRVELLRAARWRARHDGLTGSLINPVTRSLVPAREAMDALLEHVRPALDDHGTTSLVSDGLARLVEDGTGSERQRAAAGLSTDLRAVVADVVRRTRASYA